MLNISDNGLTSLAEIENLHALKHLIAQKNCINNLADITNTVKHWFHLIEMELQGNPICLLQKYRERIIINSTNLGELPLVFSMAMVA